ncbi:phage tail protein [Flavobacterium alkalisoli]|uniref:phage tail protein n=1 Tax=Flavobacterium alkalisoli TaxID=2602769 RepID=UPI003A92B9A1
MNDWYLGEIKAFAFGFSPKGWAYCDGQILPIASYQALYSLLGTTYGGDGRTTFGLPDLRGRKIVHPGDGPGLDVINWGQEGGNYYTTLITNNLPSHTHPLINSIVHTSIAANSGGSPINETSSGEFGFGTGGQFPDMYSDGGTPSEIVANVNSTNNISLYNNGGNQSFISRAPYLGINQCIAMTGLFPSRN